MKRLNPDWVDARKRAMDSYQSINSTIPEPVVTSFNMAAQWYIQELVKKNIPHKVINRGAGVKEIVIQKIKCTHCKGKGYL